MAELVTLSGTYDYPVSRRHRVKQRGEELEELLGANFLDWLKDTGSAAISGVVSPIKGATHGIMEFGRGAATGDFGRMFMAPIKGVGHTAGDWWRTQSDAAEWWWRPSKMSVWMQPVGGALTAAGAVPTPASPFLLAGGAGLTIAGGIGGSIYAKDKAGKAATQAEAEAIERAARQKNLIYYGIGAVALGALAIKFL